MTSFRTRVLSLLVLVFATVPAFAQDTAAPAATSSVGAMIGLLLVGFVALATVGALASTRDAQDQQGKTAASADEGKPTMGGSSANPGQ